MIALRDYLLKQRHREFDLTFVEGKTSHGQREAWRAAGYDVFLVRGSNKVKFRRRS
ncbi:MAG TPA: hypothetical protein VMU87_13900 [Stellaceae bacterium]|nr:hypothetical protein [Stellaceae bacterium]